MISIITSLYKSERHLHTMLPRVEKMSHKLSKAGIVHEFIFLPNNPSDNEMMLLDEYTSRVPTIKKYIRALEPIYATWNAGIEYSHYEYITFWNVDDRRFFRGFVDGIKMLNSGAGVVYFPFIYLRYIKVWGLSLLAKIKIFTPPPFDPERFSKEMHAGPFFMTTKNVLSLVGPFDSTFKIAGDFDWCVRATLAKINFVRSSVVAGVFSNDGTTISGSKSELHKEENARVLKIKT